MKRVASVAYIRVLSVQVSSSDLANTSAKLPQLQVSGQRSLVSACSSVISAVSAMKKSGARNISATASAMAWVAIHISAARRLGARERRRGVEAGAVAGVARVALIDPPRRSGSGGAGSG